MSVAELDNVISTTLNAWSKEVTNNVTNNNALLYYFKAFGKQGLFGKGKVPMGSIETKGGGKQIEEDLSIGTNSNVGFVAYNESVGTDAVDVLKTATYDWKYCYGNAVLYDAQLKVNASDEFRKHKIVEEVVKNAEESTTNAVGAALWNTTDADSINGIPALITADGTGTIGGISTTDYANWKNQFENLEEGYTGEQLLKSMAKLYRKLTRGSSVPDLIVTTPDLYGDFEAALTPLQRFTNPKMADAGFEALKFHGATVIFDENCPAGKMYFLNTKAMTFNFHRDAMFTVGEKEKLFGQPKFCWPITCMCNFSVKSRRDLGVLNVTAKSEEGQG